MKNWIIFILAAIGIGGGAYFATRSTKKDPAVPIVVTPPQVIKKDTVKWSDKRAIGMVMLANYKEFTGSDNYMNESRPFVPWLVDHAKNVVANMKAINAQGCVVWDAEGAKFPRPFTYYGDPKLTRPEVDTFFSIVRAAGFSTGVCIRPDSIGWVGGWPRHFVVSDPFANMVEKIVYANSRWGCTLFYVDSNVGVGQPVGSDNTQGAGQLMSADIFKRLHKQFPNFLLIPEHHDAGYEPYSALYWHTTWGNDLRGLAVVNTADTHWPDEHLKKAVNDGHILMGRVFWSGAPELAKIKRAYELK